MQFSFSETTIPLIKEPFIISENFIDEQNLLNTDYYNQLSPNNIFNTNFFSKDDENEILSTKNQLIHLENIITNLNINSINSQVVNYLNDLNKIYENLTSTNEERKKALFLIEILLDKLKLSVSTMLKNL